MRRLALVTIATMLALPGAAGAATFPARVVRAGGQSLTVRLADGAIVRYSRPRAANPPVQPLLLAHAARETLHGAVALNLRALEPGVTVIVTARPGSTAGAVISLPGPGAPEQHASGLVSGLRPDGFVLELPDRTALRLHGRALPVQACESAEVAYHQDAGLLVADSVKRGHAAAGNCTARTATGTIARISATGLVVGHRAFKAPAATTAGFQVGDRVEVSYTRNAGGTLTARAIEYVQHVARGTVIGAGNGTLTIDGGRSIKLTPSATPAVGEHVVVVYHQAAEGAVADAVYAQAA